MKINDSTNSINIFYQTFKNECITERETNEEIYSTEVAFTKVATNYLEENGEIDSVTLAHSEKLEGKNKHKINAYFVSEDYSSITLYISIYNSGNEVITINKPIVDVAIDRVINFFNKSFYKNYILEVAESDDVYPLVNMLTTMNELRDNLTEVNIIVLTNNSYLKKTPANRKIKNINLIPRVVDINYLFRISEAENSTIDIDFNNIDTESYDVPYLKAEINNSEYQAFISIIPGACLAKLYEKYGDRLLKQNVRSFLQFKGKINKNIKDTIINNPEMFLAYNNGIAATADSIQLDEDSKSIKSISNLQIVNGGQTTASIYNVIKEQKGDGEIDISKVFVPMKLSVIKNSERFYEIVANISKYSNFQNKVNATDLTANDPFLIEFENLSRRIITPKSENNQEQTYWFFERARGQYATHRNNCKEISRRKFDINYPKKQVITKCDLAKYLNSYKELRNEESGKLLIGPHIVVRGNQKNFEYFCYHNMIEDEDLDEQYFKNTIAKCILFKEAEYRYGTKRNLDNIGQLRQVVVPYTLSLLNILTNDSLNLSKIWRNQKVSHILSNTIYTLMKDVNEFVINNSPSSHYIEWAKKEDCWNRVKDNNWNFNIYNLTSDLNN